MMLEYLRKDVQKWLNRSLEAYYPVLFIDCVHIKIHRKRSVVTEAFYDLLAVKEFKTRCSLPYKDADSGTYSMLISAKSPTERYCYTRK